MAEAPQVSGHAGRTASRPRARNARWRRRPAAAACPLLAPLQCARTEFLRSSFPPAGQPCGVPAAGAFQCRRDGRVPAAAASAAAASAAAAAVAQEAVRRRHGHGRGMPGGRRRSNMPAAAAAGARGPRGEGLEAAWPDRRTGPRGAAHACARRGLPNCARCPLLHTAHQAAAGRGDAAAAERLPEALAATAARLAAVDAALGGAEAAGAASAVTLHAARSDAAALRAAAASAVGTGAPEAPARRTPVVGSMGEEPMGGRPKGEPRGPAAAGGGLPGQRVWQLATRAPQGPPCRACFCCLPQHSWSREKAREDERKPS
jgi:hypothetical protein